MIKSLYHIFILSPLWTMYRDMPIFGWSGKEDADICAEITAIPSIHWMDKGEEQCILLLKRKFDGHVTLILSGFQLFLTCMIICELYMCIRFIIYLKIHNMMHKNSNKIENNEHRKI